MFSYTEERSDNPALDLKYHLAPWDEAIFRGNTAAISAMKILVPAHANSAFEPFRDWCTHNRVLLVSCRLDHNQLTECAFLESHGFRFVELSYQPLIKLSGDLSENAGITIIPAVASDELEISEIAANTFVAGRLHADPQVGPVIGNRRYAAWAANAFHHPEQRVLKCVLDSRIVAFVVIEAPTFTSRVWSLIGLSHGLTGQGLGRRVLENVLAFHKREGVEKVYTSISSHNTPMHNLCLSLGFRFPSPSITLHWCPFGPVTVPTL